MVKQLLNEVSVLVMHYWIIIWVRIQKSKKSYQGSHVVNGLQPHTIHISNQLRGHPLSTYATFSEKLTFLTPWYAHVRAYQGVRNVSFSENIAYVRNGWSLIRSVATAKQKYREEKRSKKINDQKSIVTNKLEEVILKSDQLNKVWVPRS